MATAADIVRRSLKLLGVLAPGESASAEDQADGVSELNIMLGSWANDRLLMWGERRNTYTLTPNLSPHTIGPTGTFATDRPLYVDGAGVILPGTTAELPIKLLTDSEYQEIGDKALTSDVPTRLWIEKKNPDAWLWFWPVPTTRATLVLYNLRTMIPTYAASDTVTLPEGYEDAVGQALAMRLAPIFGVELGAAFVQNAIEAVAAIKRANNPDVVSRVDASLLGHGAFNIYTG